jgi:hypothetical protein
MAVMVLAAGIGIKPRIAMKRFEFQYLDHAPRRRFPGTGCPTAALIAHKPAQRQVTEQTSYRCAVGIVAESGFSSINSMAMKAIVIVPATPRNT